MKNCVTFLWSVWVLSSTPSVFVAGDYVFEVLVQSYSNPTSQRSDGRCCNNGGSTNCDNGCDNYFHYCLRDFNTPVSGNRNCRSVIMTSRVNNDAATINFTQSTVLGLSNPLVFRRSGAWEGTQLYVDVFDQDSNADDLIDVITVNIGRTSTPVGTSTTLPNLTGEYRYGMIGVTVTVMCAKDYYGEVCQFRDAFDQCDLNSVTCNERGTCEDGTDTYTCSCASGFTGRDCEININDCEGQSCSGRGTCRDLDNDYRCDCRSGYTGDFCEVIIDDCIGQNCSGNGQCVDGVNLYSCDCDTGYTGTLCDQIDDCGGVNCSGNGQCVDGVNNFTCVCQSGFTGDLCSVEIQGFQSPNVGGIVGGVVGALVILILVILLVLLLLTVLMKRNQRKHNEHTQANQQYAPGDNPTYAVPTNDDIHISTAPPKVNITTNGTSTHESEYTAEFDNPIYGDNDSEHETENDVEFDNPIYGDSETNHDYEAPTTSEAVPYETPVPVYAMLSDGVDSRGYEMPVSRISGSNN